MVDPVPGGPWLAAAIVVMRFPPSIRSESGYTLIEMMVVVMVGGVLMAMAVFQIGSSRAGMKADGAMRQVMSTLNLARESAIAQRRRMEIDFVDPNRLTVVRHEVPSGTKPISDAPFEGGVEYGVILGIVDTPDKFGNSSEISFGSAASLEFNTDGMLVDSGGSPVNGTVFMMIGTEPMSLRAVTVLGSTGRVRGFRWNGVAWTRV